MKRSVCLVLLLFAFLSGPLWAAEPQIKITGSETLGIGRMGRFEVAEPAADAVYRWHCYNPPEPDAWSPENDGKRIYFVSPTPGTFTFLLIEVKPAPMTEGKQAIALQEFKITVGTPLTPITPTVPTIPTIPTVPPITPVPTPAPKAPFISVYGLEREAVNLLSLVPLEERKNARNLGLAYLTTLGQIKAGSFVPATAAGKTFSQYTEAEAKEFMKAAVAAQKANTAEFIPSTKPWEPWADAISAKINSPAVKPKTVDAFNQIWLEIGTGLYENCP